MLNEATSWFISAGEGGTAMHYGACRVIGDGCHGNSVVQGLRRRLRLWQRLCTVVLAIR